MNTTTSLYARASGVTGSVRRRFDDTPQFPRKTDNRPRFLHRCHARGSFVPTRLSGANGDANWANYPPFLKKHEWYFSQAIIWNKMHSVLTRRDRTGSRVKSALNW
jgi:hypothetical protein